MSPKTPKICTSLFGLGPSAAIGLAAVGFVLSAGAASAADAMSLPVSSPGDVEVPVYDEAGFDWTGFYAGVYGTGRTAVDTGTQFGVGAALGVNAAFDFYLVGAEVSVEGVAGGIGETAYGQILGRAGLIVTDDVVVYGAGGYGIDLGTPSERDYLLGGGVELAVTDSVSVRAQYLHGFDTGGGAGTDQVSLGAQFHF